MTNTTRRTAACLLALALLGLVAAVVSPSRSSTEVVTVDDSTTAVATTQATVPATTSTTEVPETTTTAVTTTTVAPATTVVETTTAVPEPPPTVAAETLQPQEDAGVTPVAGDPARAARTETGKCLADEATCNPPTTPARAEWAYCEQWHELAAEVGWPESQGRVLSYVIHRESSCNPGAYNRQTCGKGNHAMGLMQLCGWLSPGEAYNPEANLRKGLELWQSSGWCPWVLRGDPVTGRACG
jgi:hypothetical protein